MPQPTKHPEAVHIKDHTSTKLTQACELLTKLDGRKCYRYYAIDRAMDLLLEKIKKIE